MPPRRGAVENAGSKRRSIIATAKPSQVILILHQASISSLTTFYFTILILTREEKCILQSAMAASMAGMGPTSSLKKQQPEGKTRRRLDQMEETALPSWAFLCTKFHHMQQKKKTINFHAQFFLRCHIPSIGSIKLQPHHTPQLLVTQLVTKKGSISHLKPDMLLICYYSYYKPVCEWFR